MKAIILHMTDNDTHTQAIDDGELIDVTETAATEGFTVPVAFTRAAYQYILDAVEDGKLVMGDASIYHYLPGVLDMIRFYIEKETRKSLVTMSFDIGAQKATFEVVCGPGDDVRPVLTVRLPGED